jgi:predicted ABC-type ATPase
VKDRVALGGHDVPEDTIRRRYALGIRNFLNMYQGIASSWHVYDNTTAFSPRLIARGKHELILEVGDVDGWRRFLEMGR